MLIDSKKIRGKEEIISFPKPKIQESKLSKKEDALWDRFTYGIVPPNLPALGPMDTV